MPKEETSEAARNGAGDESRTRDLRLGKPALYQLSYSRSRTRILKHFRNFFMPAHAAPGLEPELREISAALYLVAI